MRLTYPGRSSTTDDPDDPVRRRVLPDGRLDSISINNDVAVYEETWSRDLFSLDWNCSLTSLDERSVTCFENTYARIVPETIFLSRSFFSLFRRLPLSSESSTRRKISTFSSPLSRTLAAIERTRERDLLFFSRPCPFPCLAPSLSISLFLSARAGVCDIFLFIPFLSPLSPSKITATPHRTEVNYSCAAGSRYLKYLGSRAAATAAATAAARHRHHRCASCGPLPQTRPTPRAPIGEGEEPMCARRLHRTILSSSLCVPCFPVSLLFLPPSAPLHPWIHLSLSLSFSSRRRSPSLRAPFCFRFSHLVRLLLSALASYPFIPYYLSLSLSQDSSSFLPIGWQWSITELLLLLLVRSRLLAFFAISVSSLLSPILFRFLRIVF